MSSITDKMADDLARDVILAADELGDDRLIRDVSDVLEAASTTAQEAYMTSIRIRLALRRGRKFLDDKISRAEKDALSKANKQG